MLVIIIIIIIIICQQHMHRINTLKNFLKWLVYIYTAMALYRLDWNENLLETFMYSNNSCAFYGPELNLENHVLSDEVFNAI